MRGDEESNMTVPLSGVFAEPLTKRWSSSVPIVATVGFSISVYLALFQYGMLTSVWDPVFGQQSETVLTFGLLEPVSRIVGFPVHDAALGAVAYFVEAGLGLLLTRHRRPWLVMAYSGLALAMGFTGLGLIALQATVVRAWCLLCLTSAICSGAIVVLARHEIRKAGSLLRKRFTDRRLRPVRRPEGPEFIESGRFPATHGIHRNEARKPRKT